MGSQREQQFGGPSFLQWYKSIDHKAGNNLVFKFCVAVLLIFEVFEKPWVKIQV